ncbi:MAG: Uma2 family endonuclease, partial [Armatimonadetes bacterium]|nr:Uma2 family endonuclease [Armatimonadota bacterium]
METMTLPGARQRFVYYPETDGEPMAETDTHRNLMIDLIVALSKYFNDDPHVYVSGNLLLYYEEGNPAKSFSPDVFVVKGIEKKERPIYKLWEETKAPDVIIELTSKTTRLEDMGMKKGLYAALGVKEYFIFDPFSEYLKPHLRGYRLSGDEYALIKGKRIMSKELGLELKVEGESLRLYEVFSGKKLLTPAETAKAKEVAEKAKEEAEKKLEEARLARKQRAENEKQARLAMAQATRESRQTAKEEARQKLEETRLDKKHKVESERLAREAKAQADRQARVAAKEEALQKAEETKRARLA